MRLTIKKKKMASVCPLCQAAARSYLDYRRIGKGDYKLMRCQSCRLIFTVPLPSAEFLQNFYQSYDSFGGKESYYRNLKNYPETPAGRELIKTFNGLETKYHLDKNLPILDLGSGGGAFLDILKTRGYQSLGVEVSAAASDFARRQFGVEVINEPVESVEFATGGYGTVVMWDLLEHLRQPTEVVKKINYWLKPGGYLILETPDSRAFINRVVIGLERIGIKWPTSWMFGYHHLFWHSPKSLVKLLEDSGFKILQIKQSNTLASRIFPWSLKFFLPRLILEMINILATVIGQKNKLLVVARKL